jgi:ligand-binding sensor domain-containing protein
MNCHRSEYLQRAFISIFLASVVVCTSNAQIGPSSRGDLNIQPPGFTTIFERFPWEGTCLRILRTKDGFLWVTTVNGLARYDGYEKMKFLHPYGVADARHANSMGPIIEDYAGLLWIGSERGLHKFDGRTEKLSRYLIDSTVQAPRTTNFVACLLEDHGRGLWVGTLGGGLYRFDRDHGRFTQIPHVGGERLVSSLCEDQSGNLWAGTLAGVARLDRKAGELVPLEGDDPALQKLASDTVSTLYVDRDDNL